MSTIKDMLSFKDDKILEIVKHEFQDSADDRRNKNWQNYLRDKTFRGIDISDPLVPEIRENNLGLGISDDPSVSGGKPVRNTIYLPYARSIILTAKSMLGSVMFPNNKQFFTVEANHDMDDKAAEAFREYAHYDMRRNGYQDEAELAIERALVYDFQLLMIDWENEFSWVPSKIPLFRTIDGPDGPLAVGAPVGERAEFEWKAGSSGGATFHAPSTYNVRHDPMAIHGAITPKSCGWVGLEYKMSYKRLLDMAEAGTLIKAKVRKAEKDGETPMSTEADFDAMIRQDLKLAAERKGKVYDGEGDDQSSHALIQERWDHTSRVTIVNKKYVVRKERVVGMPFVKLVTYPVHGQFGGIPMIQDLMHIQIDVNLMTRLRRDAQNLSVNKTMILDRNAFRTEDEMDQIRLNSLEAIKASPMPGRTVKDAVSWVDPPDPGVATIQEQQNEMQFGERVVGIGDTTQGAMAAGGRKTATEHELVASSVARRGGFNARTLERAIVSEVVQKQLILYNLNLTKKQKYRALGTRGTEWNEVAPADMYFNELPDITPTGLSGEQSRALEVDAWMRLIETSIKVPAWQNTTDWVALQRETYFKLKETDPDKFIISGGLQGTDMPQEFENTLMKSGHYVTPLEGQGHEEHMAKIQEFQQSEEWAEVSIGNQSLYARHLQEHQAMLAQEQAPQVQPTQGGTPGAPPGPTATPENTSEQLAQSARGAAARTGGV